MLLVQIYSALKYLIRCNMSTIVSTSAWHWAHSRSVAPANPKIVMCSY